MLAITQCVETCGPAVEITVETCRLVSIETLYFCGMGFTYPKSEKLKSRKTIERLFAEGKSVSKFPLRLVYVENTSCADIIEMGVSVSKRHFKKAHDRNYYKRCLREAYRLNKHILLESLDKPHAFMLLYQSTERLTSLQIQQKAIALFDKFSQRAHTEN